MRIISSINNIIFRRGFGTTKWKKKFKYFGVNTTLCYPSIIQYPEKTYIGDNTTILNNSRLQNYFDKNKETDGIYIGKGCYLGFGLSILNAGRITIGNNVLMASNVLISSESHGMDPESDIPYMDQPLLSEDVTIGDGVWIGQNVCILPGVTIGEKAIIGAGSIVTRSIPSYCIAVGNPAKVIKKYNFEKRQWQKIDL